MCGLTMGHHHCNSMDMVHYKVSEMFVLNEDITFRLCCWIVWSKPEDFISENTREIAEH